MMSIVDHVFVYGTLLRGMSASNLLEELDAQFVDDGSVRGRLYITDFPRLLTSPEDDAIVYGEVFQFPNIDAALGALDQFEREGELYIRRISSVSISEKRTIRAWTYLSKIALSERFRILSGSYREHVRQQWSS